MSLVHRSFLVSDVQRKSTMNRLCGFCQSPLKAFCSKGTPPTKYTVCEKNPCPFFPKSSFNCWMIIARVAVPRETALQMSLAMLPTRQVNHATQQNQGQLQSTFLQVCHEKRPRSLLLFPVGRRRSQRDHPRPEPPQTGLFFTNLKTPTTPITTSTQEKEDGFSILIGPLAPIVPQSSS